MPRRRGVKYADTYTKPILVAIRQCATYALAAAYGGVDYDTFLSWRKRHPEFDAQVREAEAVAAVALLTRINQAAEESWQAAAWKLERRYPQDYGRQVHEMQGKDGGPVRLAVEVFREMTQRADGDSST